MIANIQKLFALLAISGAVTVDDGPLLTSWEESTVKGDPDNQILRFSWTGSDRDYDDILDEGGIAGGVFHEDGKFTLENSEGETSVIRFFAIEPLKNTHSGKHAAKQFFDELLESVETLTGIAEFHGQRTLADVMYLQMAILNDSYIDCILPTESAVLEIVRTLPSAEQWMKFIKLEPLECTSQYDAVKNSVFASAVIRDGYNGHVSQVEVALLGNQLVYVTDTGYFTAPGFQPITIENETLWELHALWVLENDPNSRVLSVVVYDRKGEPCH